MQFNYEDKKINIINNKYNFNIDDYGYYYRPLIKDDIPPEEEWIGDLPGFLRKAKLINYHGIDIWDYHLYGPDGSDYFSLSSEDELSYQYDRLEINLKEISKRKNNILNIKLEIKNKFLSYQETEDKIISKNINNILIISTNQEEAPIFNKEFNFKKMTSYEFSFDIDLSKYNNNINLFVELKDLGNYPKKINKKFNIDFLDEYNKNIDLINNDSFFIKQKILANNSEIKYEDIIFERCIEKEMIFPKPIHDLFSIKYIDESLNRLEPLFPEELFFNYKLSLNENKKYKLKLNRRFDNNKVVYYVSDFTYFDIKKRYPFFGKSNLPNNYEGLTLDWDHPSNAYINGWINLSSYNNYDFNLSIDFLNKKPLVGSEGKWKIIEKRD